MNSRLKRNLAAVEYKDDDYETTTDVLKDLLPFLENDKKIYDPFFCNGKVKDEWKELGYDCYNKKEDAFNSDPPEFDYLISNIPFTLKEKCIELALKYDKPFMLLMPIDALGSLWIGKYFDKLQYIIPKKRYNFYKKGVEKKSSSWFDTMWVCYKMDLDSKIIKLK